MNQRLYKWVDGALEEREIDSIDVAAWLAHGWSLTVPTVLEPMIVPTVLEPIEPNRRKSTHSETK